MKKTEMRDEIKLLFLQTTPVTKALPLILREVDPAAGGRSARGGQAAD